jgi:hypothetical protein
MASQVAYKRFVLVYLRGLHHTHPEFNVRFYHSLKQKVSFDFLSRSLLHLLRNGLFKILRAFKTLHCIWHGSGLRNCVHTVLKLHDVAEQLRALVLKYLPFNLRQMVSPLILSGSVHTRYMGTHYPLALVISLRRIPRSVFDIQKLPRW